MAQNNPEHQVVEASLAETEDSFMILTLSVSEGSTLVLSQMIVLLHHCSCLAADSASDGLQIYETERKEKVVGHNSLI